MDSANQAKSDSPFPIKISPALLTDLRSIITKAGYPDVSRIEKEVLEEIQHTWSKTDYCRIDTGQRFQEIIDRLQTNEPWEYIRGWAEFCENKFKVTTDTLIPRLETEVLVELTVNEIRSFFVGNPGGKLNILEIGTGSGAIIVSIVAKLRELGVDMVNVNFIATDISRPALEVAELNARKVLKDHQIQLLNTDLLNGLQDLISKDEKWIIVANLPYLSDSEYLDIDASVRDFEPKSALVGGKVGDEMYKELFIQSKEMFGDNLIAQLWETSPMIIDGLADYLVKSGAKAEKINDQFEVKRFIRSF